jgi:AcrR family transcriptional regulator
MYDRKKIFEQAKDVIVKNKLFFIEDIVAFLPCSKSTFYEHFPNESDLYKKLVELLETNRTELKVSMRSKWYKSNAPALQMALMKLLSTPEELRLLSMNTQSFEGAISVVWNETKNYEPDQEADTST